MKNIVLIILLLLPWSILKAQINIALLHQLVSESKSEYEHQRKLRDDQATVLANEAVNTQSAGKLKSTYRQISSRFSLASSLLQVLQVSQEASPLIAEIYRNESLLISLCGNDPLLVPLALSAQGDLVERSAMLLRFLYGLVLSSAELSQMGQADRKLLFSQVTIQLSSISGSLKGLCQVVAEAARKKHSGGKLFSDFTGRDRELIDNILRGAGNLKSRP